MNEEKIELIRQLSFFGIPVPQILALLYGFKPCSRLYSGIKNNNQKIQKIITRLGLKAAIAQDQPKVQGNFFFIGTNDLIIQKALFYEKVETKIKNQIMSSKAFYGNLRSYINFQLATLLGYPKCCIEFYLQTRPATNELLFFTTNATLNPEELDYRLNFLLNYDNCRGDIMGQKNLNCDSILYNNLFLIPHVPCSFDCQLSKKYAKSVVVLLKKYFPDYLKNIEHYLKKPFLFINDFEFLIFEGTVNKNILSYSDTIDSNNLFKKTWTNKIKEGNRLIKNENNFLVFKDNHLLHKINAKVEIFNFN